MEAQQQTTAKPSNALVLPQGSTGLALIQRKCVCGGLSGMSGSCPECEKNKLVGKPLQTKLRINEPGDQYEQEADRIADQLMATPAQSVVNSAPPRIQRFTGQATGQTGTAPASVDHILAGSGRPLEPALRQDMERRFGHDFSRVRVHSGAAAEQSARDVNANAYTVGHDIVFGTGRFAPAAREGCRLLAHELTHVVQQANQGGLSSSSLQRQPTPASDPLRAAAEAEGLAVVRTGEQQSDAEDALKLDPRKRQSKDYAWKHGVKDRDRMRSRRDLTPKHKYEVAVKVRFFRGEAKLAYIQTISPTLAEVAEDGPEILDETKGAGEIGGVETPQGTGQGRGQSTGQGTSQSTGQGAPQLKCDLGKREYVLEYEGEPWLTRCMDITTDPEANNIADFNIVDADGYAVKGTTWENVEYDSFKVMRVKYKNGRFEYFMLNEIGDFRFSDKHPRALRNITYLKRPSTGLIYPVAQGDLHFSETFTPNILRAKNGLKHQVKEIQELYELLQVGGTFAGILGSYSAVSGPSGVRSAFTGFRSVKTSSTKTPKSPPTRTVDIVPKRKVSPSDTTTESSKPPKQTGKHESQETGTTVLSRTDDPAGGKGEKKIPAKKIAKQQETQTKGGGKQDDESEDPKGGKAPATDKKPDPAPTPAVKTDIAKMSEADKATRVGEIRQERAKNDAEMKELQVKIDAANERSRVASAKAVDAEGDAKTALVDSARRNKASAERWKADQDAVRLRNRKLREEESRLLPPNQAPKSWQEAEGSLRTEFGGKKQTLSTATKDGDLGERDIDCFTPHDKVSREAKFGRQSLGKDIRAEIAKDKALQKAGRVSRTEWHFYENPDSGAIGPDSNLKAELDDAGITVRIKR